MDQQNPDPHGYVAEGEKRAWAYLYRQMWLMRYPSIALAVLMSGYTIWSQSWIPLIEGHIVNFMMFFMMWWFSLQTLKKLSIGAVQMEKTQHIHLPMVFKRMGTVAWVLWGLSVVANYWIICIIYINFFAGT